MEWCPIDVEPYDFKVRNKMPKALDGSHPGQDAHNAFAKLVINSIDNRNFF